MRLRATATVSTKHHFSKQHLKAASYFAKRAAEIEATTTATNPLSEETLSQHRAYVTGAVLSAVAALESSINELYLEARDRDPNALKGLDLTKLTSLVELWPTIERFSILHKYQKVLQTVGASKFNIGQLPYQDADSLIKLRNALIHYKPEWDNKLDIHKNLKKRLCNKFKECIFTDSTYLWFPHRCLGCGCAQWSVDTINKFVHEFCQRVQIPDRF